VSPPFCNACFSGPDARFASSYGRLGQRVISDTLHTMWDRGLIPQLMMEELVYPFAPDVYIDDVLAPEVAVCLIMEDMELDPTRFSRLHRRKRAYELLCASRDFGALIHPEPPALSLHLLEESSWEDMEPWNDCRDPDRRYDPIAESDTDEMMRLALRVARGREREAVMDSEDEVGSPSQLEDRGDESRVDPATGTTETIAIDGIYVPTTDPDEGYVPPMRGAPTPYGVSHPTPVSSNGQERFSHVRSPRGQTNSQQRILHFKAPRLKHIPTSAELMAAHDLLQKKAEQQKANAAQKLAEKERRAEEKREQRERREEEKRQEQQEVADRRAARDEKKERERQELARKKAEREKEQRRRQWEIEDKRLERERQKAARVAVAREKEQARVERLAAAETKRQQQEAKKSRKADARSGGDKSQQVPTPQSVTRPKPVRRRLGDVDRLATIQEHEIRDGSQTQTPVPGSQLLEAHAVPAVTTADDGIRGRLRSRARH
jgi:hypothetical protein